MSGRRRLPGARFRPQAEADPADRDRQRDLVRRRQGERSGQPADQQQQSGGARKSAGAEGGDAERVQPTVYSPTVAMTPTSADPDGGRSRNAGAAAAIFGIADASNRQSPATVTVPRKAAR